MTKTGGYGKGAASTSFGKPVHKTEAAAPHKAAAPAHKPAAAPAPPAKRKTVFDKEKETKMADDRKQLEDAIDELLRLRDKYDRSAKALQETQEQQQKLAAELADTKKAYEEALQKILPPFK